MRISLAFIVVVMATLIFQPLAAKAADSYRVNIGQTVTVDEHGVCKKVTNSGAGGEIFIPTRSAAEWLSFRNGNPAGTSLADCPLACGGYSWSGACWYSASAALGSTESCAQKCASRGGCNVTAMRNIVGSSGTDANCIHVIHALNIDPKPDYFFISNNTGARGCFTDTMLGRLASRDTSAPTSCTEPAGFSRYIVCACNN